MLKTFRDMRETIGSFISIVAVIIIGCFFFAGITAGSNAVTDQVNDYAESQHYATARADYMYVNSPAVDEIASDEKVKRAAGYNTFFTQTRVKGIRRDVTITTLTDNIDIPYMISGRLPEKNAKEIIIDQVSADKLGVKVGDGISFDIATVSQIALTMSTQGTGGQTPKYELSYKDVHYDFTVSGIFHSPDIIYKVNIRNTAASPDEFIMAQVNYGDIELFTEKAEIIMPPELEQDDIKISKIASSVQVYNGIKVVADGRVDYEALFGRYSLSSAQDIFRMLSAPNTAAGLFMYVMERDSFPSVVAFDGINDTIAALAAVLPIMFFAVAAAITVISLSKTVDNQRTQIGVIQALGVGKGAVYFSYIFYALFACIIGGTVGGVVGIITVPKLINILYNRQFYMPPTAQNVSPLFLILGIVVAAALACLAAFLACHHTLKVNPAQAMRPKPPKKTKRIFAERWTFLWSRLGFGAKMNLRNMFLHKVRMLLSSVGIIGCLALLIGLIGLKDNMDFSLDKYYNSAEYDLTLVVEAPIDLTAFDFDEIAEQDGVEYLDKLTFTPTFSGRFSFKGKTADMTVMALPTAEQAKEIAGNDKYNYLDPDCVKLYADQSGKKLLKIKDNTFAIPTTLADELGVKKGDTVTVSGYSLDNRAIEFDIKITDVIYEYFEQNVYCSYSTFDSLGVGLFADTAYVKVKKGTSLKTALGVLEGYDIVRDVRSFEDTYTAREKRMEMLDYAAILFTIGAGVLAVAVIYNITATNLKERTREIATLMVLGYKPVETASMVLVENMFITLLGCLIGLPFGYGLMMWLVEITSSFHVLISSFFSWYVAIGCMAMTFAFSLLATLMFNTKIKNISMVEALKSVE
ncbi:MAG: ABC transporter permease [Clostridiales bacterium]|nr:ABC transporter permease [Clostridiales bacterium]